MEMTPDYSYHGPVAVFDLDDTLISERDFCRRGFLILEQALTDAGIPAEGLAAEMTALLEKREPYMPAFEKIIAEEEVDKALNNRLLDLYGNSTRPLEPRADVRQTLDRLAALGTVMALVTDGRPATQRAKLRSAGLERYFAPHLIYIRRTRYRQILHREFCRYSAPLPRGPQIPLCRRQSRQRYPLARIVGLGDRHFGI